MLNKYVAKLVDKLLKIRDNHFKTCEAHRIANNLHNTILKPINPYERISKHLEGCNIEYFVISSGGDPRMYGVDSEGKEHRFGFTTNNQMYMQDKFGPSWFRNYYVVEDGQFVKYQDRKH